MVKQVTMYEAMGKHYPTEKAARAAEDREGALYELRILMEQQGMLWSQRDEFEEFFLENIKFFKQIIPKL